MVFTINIIFIWNHVIWALAKKYFEEFITLKRLVRLLFFAIKSHSSIVNTVSQFVSKAVV